VCVESMLEEGVFGAVCEGQLSVLGGEREEVSVHAGRGSG
jgi:hypothetical protein